MGEGLVSLWPGAMILLLAAVAIRDRRPVPWRRIAPFLFLPAAYAVYFYPSTGTLSPRFLAELAPAAFIATALVVERLSVDGRVGWGAAWASVAVAVAVTAGSVRTAAHQVESREAYFSAVEEARDPERPLLVLVAQREGAPDEGRVEHALEGLYWYNTHPEMGIVVARHLAHREDDILSRFPQHGAILLEAPEERSDGTWPAPRVIPLHPSELPGMPADTTPGHQPTEDPTTTR